MQAVGIVDQCIGGQADEPVVRRAVLLVDKVGVVRGYDLDAVLLRKAEDAFVGDQLVLVDVEGQTGDLCLVQLDLQVIVVAENGLVPLHGLAGPVPVAGDQRAGNLSRQAGRAADEPVVILLDDLVGHAGLVIVLALDVTDGDDLHEVAVAGGILGQKDQVIVSPVGGILELVVVMPRNIHLAANDGLDLVIAFRILMLSGHLEELLDPVHVAVVRDGESGHSELRRTLEKLPHIGESVKDGVLCVDVKMDERHRWKFEKQR